MARWSNIEKREGPRGTKYLARVRLGDDPANGKPLRVSKAFSTEREAKAWITEQRHAAQQRQAVTPSAQTVKDLLLFWLDTHAKHTVRPTTLENYTEMITRHIIPGIGALKVQQLTARHLQKFYSDKVAAETGRRTVQLCHLRIKQALDLAVSLGMVPTNVADRVTPPRQEATEQATWTAEQARRFAEVAGTHSEPYGPMWLLLMATGLRRGEALGLRWQDLDLDRGTLRVVQAITILNSLPHVTDPKSRSGRRSMSLPAPVVAALREHRVRQVEHRLKIADLWTDHGLVFCTGFGAPVHPNTLRRIFGRLCAQAGVPQIRIHDIRHTYATLALESGADLLGVSRQLGHSKPSITSDIYAHVTDRMQQRVTDTMGAVLFGETAPSTESWPLNGH
jgi:integrase